MANGAAPRPRADQWRHRDFEMVRDDIADDLDEHERRFAAIARDVASIRRLLIAVLISTTTAAVVLALNLAVGGSVR